MDPVTQTLAQQHSGSANGQGFGDFFVAGARSRQQDRSLNLFERKLEFEKQQDVRAAERHNMLLPLERDMMNAQIAAVGLRTKAQQMELEQTVKKEAAGMMVRDLMTQLERDGTWGTPESWKAFDAITKHHPLAATTSAGEEFLQVQRLRSGISKLTQQFGGPSELTTPTVEGGVAKFGNDPLSAQRVEIAKQNLQARLAELELSTKRLEAQLPPMEREKLRAGLQAIARDPLIIDSDSKLKKMDEFLRSFQRQGQGPVQASPVPTNPNDPLGLFAK